MALQSDGLGQEESLYSFIDYLVADKQQTSLTHNYIQFTLKTTIYALIHTHSHSYQRNNQLCFLSML